MRKKVKFIGLMALVLVLALLGFKCTHHTTTITSLGEKNWSENAPFVQYALGNLNAQASQNRELKFYLHGDLGKSKYPGDRFDANFGVSSNDVPAWNVMHDRSINKTNLLGANRIDDLIRDYPSSWIKNYDAVWIKELGGNNISLMSESNELSNEQKKVLSKAAIGTIFDVVIDYHSSDNKLNEVEYHRLNVALTLVPEKEAEYSAGYDALMSYFEENSREIYERMEVKKFASVAIRFSINENGLVEDVEQNGESGYNEIDQHIIALVNSMPAWIPAEDAKGKRVKQTFELIYGRPGC